MTEADIEEIAKVVGGMTGDLQASIDMLVMLHLLDRPHRDATPADTMERLSRMAKILAMLVERMSPDMRQTAEKLGILPSGEGKPG